MVFVVKKLVRVYKFLKCVNKLYKIMFLVEFIKKLFNLDIEFDNYLVFLV